MSIPSDHKALIFVGAVAILGAAVRIIRAATNEAGSPLQPALEHQIQASDSAAHAGHGQGRGRSSRRTSRRGQTALPGPDTALRIRSAPLLDRPGYIGSRLDLDVATAAQIDSLPGVTPAMARRIVRDRMSHGPFLSLDGLRRVSGAWPRFVEHLDTLVTFSGVFRAGSPDDTLIPKRKARSRRPSRSPPPR
ncbi:MAG TPA: helix-hairpin-helix domain-containing protein [Gemmatimonadaceae bacterium]|nr:helix-hairpin-helix domain-containing protein [Gemmatimonadaceae bacterium]